MALFHRKHSSEHAERKGGDDDAPEDDVINPDRWLPQLQDKVAKLLSDSHHDTIDQLLHEAHRRAGSPVTRNDTI